MNIQKIAWHLSKYLSIYSIIILSLGVVNGYYSRKWIKENKMMIANMITLFIFLTVYPMMINLSMESLRKGVKR